MWYHILVKVVLDTNVLYSAVRSRRGASFALLQQVGTGAFQPVVSVALCLEYEDVLLREPTALPAAALQDLLDYLVSVSLHQRIHFLWRPALRDPKNDLVLELAANAGCAYIVTFNLRDFRGCERFGVTAITPPDFLALLGGTS